MPNVIYRDSATGWPVIVAHLEEEPTYVQARAEEMGEEVVIVRSRSREWVLRRDEFGQYYRA